ncbi:hypothetical protein PICSAR11_04438 [Mycobacterium avium subsp. paratuberculosis]|nr:hypothetical protein PICSAR11_04438 [Mycobacterium avium subsp. paratuberculosis]
MILQPHQARAGRARLPDAEHHHPGGRREGGGGRHRAIRAGRRAIGQPARRVGGIDAVHQIQRAAGHLAAMGVEDQHLSQMRDHQQLAVPEEPRGGGHADHRLAPAGPLGHRKRQERPGLADVEVVEAVEQRTGEAAALDQPHAPPLPAVVGVLPLHQRTAGRGLGVEAQVTAGAQRRPGGQAALDRAGPLQRELAGPAGAGVAAVGGVRVLGRPALRGRRFHPRVGVAARAGPRRDDRRQQHR